MSLIYFDNAATTPLSNEVKEAMVQAMDEFGNPSSVHAVGRKSKSLIEGARKKISTLLNCQPGEITFTSGGTEANNLAIFGMVESGNMTAIISSKLEHPAVVESIKKASHKFQIPVFWVNTLQSGSVDLNDLRELLTQNPKSLVSLMHVNNEIGTVLDIRKVGLMCREFGAKFHSDTVQSMGHVPINVNELPVDLLTYSAHKLNGPKGVGFLFHRKGTKVHAQIVGGKQEREFRGGTENSIGIAGLIASFEHRFENFEVLNTHLLHLKNYFISQIKTHLPDVTFNGNCTDSENSQNSMVSINFPQFSQNDMLLFQMDLKGIMVSGGSACSSGSVSGSHVLNELGISGANIRVSFGTQNTIQEIDAFMEVLKELK
tara:strand:+ start:73912 stop:75033 length:1122 start_codon:yes stop_codon:yes gene_type:complete